MLVSLRLDLLMKLRKCYSTAYAANWPFMCTGHKACFQKLVPGLPPTAENVKYFMLMAYKELAHKHNLDASDMFAQLCWQERRKKGILQDCGLITWCLA